DAVHELGRLLAISPVIVPIPGATRPETVRTAARAKPLRAAPVRVQRFSAAEVVLVIGVPGAGKSRIAAQYVARGYARLNRDERVVPFERVEFVREPRDGVAGTFVAASAWPVQTEGPALVFDWRPDGTTLQLDGVETAVCPHGAGPPACWCRPPLPGLVLEFARRHNVDPARSTLVGTSQAHRTLAATLGATFVTPQP